MSEHEMLGKPYDAELDFVFQYPTKVAFGVDVVEDVGMEMSGLGCEHALIVTDSLLRGQTDIVARVEKALGDKRAAIFDGVEPDSGLHLCEAGAEVGREAGVDCIVSVGGGSAIDTAKGIAILLREGGRLSDHEGFQNLTRPQTPHIAIPTTAGTGSEVTYVAVIKDHEQKRKVLFGSTWITPNVALLDPTLTVGLPPMLSAATGMDALSHAIEAMHSQVRQPIPDGLALHAIRLIRAHLETATRHGDDLHARGQMLIAANMAGAAFGNAQVGLVHAMAHTVGARWGIHHGAANALFLPHVIRFNAEECADTYKAVAEALGVDVRAMSDAAAAEAAAGVVAEMVEQLGLPTRLRDTGVKRDGIDIAVFGEEELESMAEATLYDGAIVYNGRLVFEASEILDLYRKAW